MNAPKGTRDLDPPDVIIRKQVIATIAKHYELYGGQHIETPTFEKKKMYENLYGEDFQYQVHTLENKEKKDGEAEILRFDLTGPLARYVAKHGLQSFRACQVGKVFRHETANAQQGRFREFVQYDFDIIGTDYGQMMFDSEIIELLTDVLNDLIGSSTHGPDGLMTYTVHINHRKILGEVLSKLGVSDELFHPVCSTLDKLDKLTREAIETELKGRGLSPEIVTNIMKMVDETQKLERPEHVIQYLQENNLCQPKHLHEMTNLLDTLDQDTRKNIVWTLTLARGLHYYTGLIYEVTYNDKNIISSTIASGGRYDDLIEKFSGTHTPAIGLSVGIERIVTILERTGVQANVPKPQVFVASIGKNMGGQRIKLCQELRRRGIIAKTLYTTNPKMNTQLDQVFQNDLELGLIVKIPYMVIIGGNELANKTIKIKDVAKHDEVEVERESGLNMLVDLIQNK